MILRRLIHANMSVDGLESNHMQQVGRITDRLRLALRAFTRERPWVRELSLLCKLTGSAEDPMIETAAIRESQKGR